MTNLEKANQVRRRVLGAHSVWVGGLGLGQDDRAKFNRCLLNYMPCRVLGPGDMWDPVHELPEEECEGIDGTLRNRTTQQQWSGKGHLTHNQGSGKTS